MAKSEISRLQPALSKRVLANYSGVSVPLAAMTIPISVYLPPFYGGSLGLSLTTVGLIFTLARIWDVVTDPIMGAIIDHFDTRWGRRKHWVAIAVPLLMLSVWMVFMPNPDRVSSLYLGFWLVLLYGVTIKLGLYFVAEPGNVPLFWGYTLI